MKEKEEAEENKCNNFYISESIGIPNGSEKTGKKVRNTERRNGGGTEEERRRSLTVVLEDRITY